MSSMLQIRDSGIVCRNPLPGHQAVSVTHPFIVRFSDMLLHLTYRPGRAVKGEAVTGW